MTTGGRTAEQNPADAHDVIRVVGARENNLRDIDVVIPKRRLTVFTGVSGSGKSSLVFATIAAESRRLVNETYPAFVQGFMEASARPAVDRLEGLTAAITVDQERLGANPRSTLGTVSDVGALLRVLYSTHGTPHIGSPQAFAFNVPSVTGGGAVTTQRGGRKIVERKTFTVQGGMCPRCEGMGRVSDIDLTQVLDETLSLKDGAITVPGYSAGGWQVRSFTDSGLFPPDVPVAAFTPRQRDDLLYKEPTKIKVGGINTTYEGLVSRIRKSMLAKEPEALQPHIRAFVERAVVFGTCPQCHGTRLSEPARTCLIDGKLIADACTRKHRARHRAQARDDLDRRSRGGSGPGSRKPRRSNLLRGNGRAAAPLRHSHRTPHGRPGAAQEQSPLPHGHDENSSRQDEQSS